MQINVFHIHTHTHMAKSGRDFQLLLATTTGTSAVKWLQLTLTVATFFLTSNLPYFNSF